MYNEIRMKGGYEKFKHPNQYSLYYKETLVKNIDSLWDGLSTLKDKNNIIPIFIRDKDSNQLTKSPEQSEEIIRLVDIEVKDEWVESLSS